MVTAGFLAVMLIVMEDKAAATLTLVAAEGVDAVLLAAAIILGALVLVCRGANKGRCRVCAGLRSGRSPQGKWEAWLGFLPPGGWAGSERPMGSGTASSGASRSQPSGAQLWGEKGGGGRREA